MRHRRRSENHRVCFFLTFIPFFANIQVEKRGNDVQKSKKNDCKWTDTF